MGDIYWNKMHPTARLFTSNDINEISNEVFRIQIDPDNLVDSFRMALFYTNRKIVIENNKDIFNDFVDIDNNEMITSNIEYKSVEDYIYSNKDMMIKFIHNHNSVSASM